MQGVGARAAAGSSVEPRGCRGVQGASAAAWRGVAAGARRGGGLWWRGCVARAALGGVVMAVIVTGRGEEEDIVGYCLLRSS